MLRVGAPVLVVDRIAFNAILIRARHARLLGCRGDAQGSVGQNPRLEDAARPEQRNAHALELESPNQVFTRKRISMLRLQRIENEKRAIPNFGVGISMPERHGDAP
jgi:hypothetical protein